MQKQSCCTLLLELQRGNQIPSGSIHRSKTIASGCPELDLKMRLQRELLKIRFDLSFVYIKLHQDKIILVTELSLLLQMNLECYKAATGMLDSLGGPTPPLPPKKAELQAFLVTRKQTVTETTTISLAKGTLSQRSESN